MKLAIVRQRYTPFGGAERFVERALAALEADRTLELTLICRRWQGPAEAAPQRQTEAALQRQTETAPQRRILTCDPAYFGRLWRDRSFAACARARFGEFDLVQSHERIPGCHIYRAGDGVHAAWLDRLGAARGRLGRSLLRAAPYHRYVLAAERAMFAHADLRAVICNSQLVADEVARYYGVPPARLHVIANGVDLERFHPRLADQHRDELRRRLGIPVTAPLLLFVGSGFERKGVGVLLQALARLGGDAHLLVVGADRRLPQLQALAGRLGLAGRVHFTGGVADPRPYYGAADVFVLPTLYDPFPNAALEAFACGLPVITSSGCGAAEFVRDGENGYVVEALDVAGLAERLAAITAGERFATMRGAARQSVEALSLDRLAAALQGLYRQLAGIVPPS